jgi:hypothetical protein
MFENLRVDDETQKARLKICKACEHNKLRNTISICGKCGCILQLKTQWKGTHCPVNKWGKAES